MPSFAVRNFGCRVNQAEAFVWADAFRERGLRLDEDWGRSDVVLVNSCTLTGRAERDVRKFIRAVHRGNPGTKIVVTGCYAERAPAEIAALPGVVAVLPQSAKDGIADRAMELEGLGAIPDRAGTAGCTASTNRDGDVDKGASLRARAYLKIQDGCDNRCAYCIIPSVRGRSRSVRPEDVVTAVRDLDARGFREIVLAGIHLSSYGEDLEPRGSLLSLFGELGDAAGRARLRLSSLDPRKTDAALMSHIAGDPRICPHVHLSLQHASRRILGLMGRPIADGSSASTLDEMARLAPEAALGADVMVGFPGETEDDFEELRGFIERSALTSVHVFSYSPRPGTPAAARPQIPAGVVTERAKALRRLSAVKNFRFRRRFLGRELEAVVIDKSEKGAEVLTGNFIGVLVPSCPAPERELVRVSIRRVLPRRTEGEIIP
jgi:threonylcarbamoyladenosine tRNA methylthiotransferase MtaB